MKASAKAKSRARSRKRDYPKTLVSRTEGQEKVVHTVRLTKLEYDRVKKAAYSIDSQPSINLFSKTAILKETDRILGQPPETALAY